MSISLADAKKAIGLISDLSIDELFSTICHRITNVESDGRLVVYDLRNTGALSVFHRMRIDKHAIMLYNDSSNCCGWIADGIIMYPEGDEVMMADCVVKDHVGGKIIEASNSRHASIDEILFHAMPIDNLWREFLKEFDNYNISYNDDREGVALIFNINGKEEIWYTLYSLWDYVGKEFIGSREIVVPIKISSKAAEFIIASIKCRDLSHMRDQSSIQVIREICEVADFLGFKI